jgi:hypothetical protein
MSVQTEFHQHWFVWKSPRLSFVPRIRCMIDIITGFVTRLTRRVPPVVQELPTLPEHQSSFPVFIGVRITRSLILCVCFLDRCLSFCTLCCMFFFDLRILITPLVSSNSSCIKHLWLKTKVCFSSLPYISLSVFVFLAPKYF